MKHGGLPYNWQQIRVQKIERDEDIIQYLINMERDFWLNHVEKDEPPMFDGSEASTLRSNCTQNLLRIVLSA